MADDASQPDSTVDYTQETRMAVVMYGGSSLAIYMNGVAQEMLRLVRATAPNPTDETRPFIPDANLSGSERAYRKLGKILTRGGVRPLEADTPISTRFVIDILSGTSAGGINAVFLAKALANDQNIAPLKDLWLKQGDIGVLINDKQSDKDIKIGTQDPPRSILNSRRMYYELLDALEGMDRGAKAGDGAKAATSSGASPHTKPSPYVEELDLYTTATDIWGQVISICLADSVATERKHLNTFHFVYNHEQNDFTRDKNPFMAFAARCTSAHPAPFEPMRLYDINEILDKHPSYKDTPDFRSNDKRWRHFFEEYLQRAENGADPQPATHAGRARLRDSLASKFERRPFSDGGVLDNSPFSFAINKLPSHHTKLPVDRKLLYIEPVPKHPERELDPERPPNAFQNGWLSLSVLPSYQFIREDLQHVLDRNRLIERVGRILQGVEKDEKVRKTIEAKARRRREGQKETGEADEGSGDAASAGTLTTYQFGKKTLGEMIERMGSSWGGYQRLRVAETTDELVKIIASAAGFYDESDEFLAIRYLVRVWRDENYDPYGVKDPDMGLESLHLDEPVPGKLSHNWFLFQYDLKWRIRRLTFVLNKVDDLADLDERAQEMMEITGRESVAEAGVYKGDEGRAKAFRKYLQGLKVQLCGALKVLEAQRRSLMARVTDDSSSQSNVMGDAVAAIEIEPKDLVSILEKPTDEACEAAARELLGKERVSFERFLSDLYARLKATMDDASSRVRGDARAGVRGVLEMETETPSTLEAVARETLRYYYDNFDRYDMISYPILYATNAGAEIDAVEVFRISPEDAGFLVPDEGLRKRKLAGASLANFGAFFDETFRTNDILWGRLDCADRLITALLSNAEPSAELEATRAELIKEASRAIIAEELRGEDRAGLRGLIAAQMSNARPGESSGQFIKDLERSLTAEGPPDLAHMREFLRTCLGGTDPVDDFVQTCKFEHELPSEVMVRSSARASRVFGKMLEGVADEERWNKKPFVWVTRLTQLFWGLVEVAVPGSIPNLIFRHWLKLLYLFEFLMLLLGTLLLNSTVQQFGLLAFGITAAVHGVSLLMGDVMAGKGGKPVALWWGLLKALVLTLFIIMAVLGVFFLVAVLGADERQNSFANGIWEAAARFRRWLGRYEPNGRNLRTLVRFSVPAIVGLFFLWSVRGDVRDYFRRRKDKA